MGWLAPNHPGLRDVAPMPADFSPPLQRDQKAIRWRGRVNGGVELEVGFPLSDPKAEEKTKLAAWHVLQLAELGRHDLLKGARTDRHSRTHKPMAPQPILRPPGGVAS